MGPYYLCAFAGFMDYAQACQRGFTCPRQLSRITAREPQWCDTFPQQEHDVTMEQLETV
jgi:hypothetical protein|eukprot:COSAG01_NODE_3502_length_5999_cov_31.512542_2_plen_59_part_00